MTNEKSETTEATDLSIITLPSGLKGRIGKWSVANLARFLNAAGPAQPAALASLLASAWEETLDAGPYPFLTPGAAHANPARLVIQDVFAATLKSRAYSISRWLEVPYRCECQHENVVEIDLLSGEQFETTSIPAETARVLRTTIGVFHGTLRGKRITYRLLTSSMLETVTTTRARIAKERKAAKLEPLPAQSESDYYAAQTDFIEELGDEKSRDQAARLDFFLGIFPTDEYDFAEQLRVHDFGVRNLVEHACDGCGELRLVRINLDKDFFRPARLPKRELAERAARAPVAPPTAATSAALEADRC